MQTADGDERVGILLNKKLAPLVLDAISQAAVRLQDTEALPLPLPGTNRPLLCTGHVNMNTHISMCLNARQGYATCFLRVLPFCTAGGRRTSRPAWLS